MLATALATALLLAGCGAAGDGGPSSSGEGKGGADASGDAGANAGGETAGLGTPSLGREDAPVVLTEYSDYQ